MHLSKWLKPASTIMLLSLLTACGGGGNSDSGGSTTLPPPANIAPTANAGDNQAVDELTEVTLSGSGTDSDGSIVSYQWEQTAGTSITLSSTDSASANFTAPDINADETLTFKLTVTDDDGSNANSTTQVTIKAVGFSGIVTTGSANEINPTNAKISGSWVINTTEMVGCKNPYWPSDLDITVEYALNNSPLGLCIAVDEEEHLISGLTCGTKYKYLFAIQESGITSWANPIKGEVKEFTTTACDIAPSFPPSFRKVYIEQSDGLVVLTTEESTIVVDSGQYLLAEVNPDEFSSDTELKFEISQNNSLDIIYTESASITIRKFFGLVGERIPDTLICDTEYRVRAVASTQWNEVFSDYHNIKMAPCNIKTQDFKVTTGSYDETQDNNQACISEFGTSYQIADWNDIVNYHSTYSSMDDFFTAVSMPSPGQEGARSLQVSKDGSELYSSSRHYFITRHDHSKPGYYLSHANIDDHLIDLGSWNGARPVLCLNNSTSTQEIETIKDAYGNITNLTSIEETTVATVQSSLELVDNEKLEATVNIVANDTPLTLGFFVTNKNLIDTQNPDDVRVILTEKDGGYEITIPKSMMASWAASGAIVSSNGKEIPAGALTVIDDDPVLFWNSELTPFGDYVTAVNIETEEKGNKAIEMSSDFWNEYYDSIITLQYQVLYYANYSAINSTTREIHVKANMAEDGPLDFDEYLKTTTGESRHELDISSTKTGSHTSGVYYHIGPDGWYAQDAKTLEIIDEGGEQNIGSFKFPWDPMGSLIDTAFSAEFFAHISITDGNLEEEYDGDIFHFNKKLPYKRPVLRVTSPTEGEQLEVGSTYNIQWESYYLGHGIETEFSYGEESPYSPNQGDLDNYTIISTHNIGGTKGKDTGQYEWTVPNVESDALFIRMKRPAARLLNGAYDSSFSKQFSIVGTTGPICDANNLNLCTTESTCLSAGGYWYDNACHSEAKEANPPVASFTTDCNNLTCTFNASTSYDPDGSITNYRWNFGDGITGTEVNAEHSYANAGSYTVVLTVTDNTSLADTTSKIVTVSEAASIVPQNVEAVAGDEEITVSWEPVAGATQYVVFMSDISGQFSYLSAATLDGESSTSYTFGGRINGTQYYFVVLSIVNGIESDYSNEVSAVPTAEIPPGDSDGIYYETSADNDTEEYAQELGKVDLLYGKSFTIIGKADSVTFDGTDIIGGKDYYTFIAPKSSTFSRIITDSILNATVTDSNGLIIYDSTVDLYQQFEMIEGHKYLISIDNHDRYYALYLVPGAEYAIMVTFK